MSNRRPYTAILCSTTKTQIVEINASVDFAEAKSEVTTQFPTWDVVALLAGSHASRGRSFDRTRRIAVGKDEYVDPFDTPDQQI